MTDSKSRFSSRVENYIRYRPGYPSGVIDALRNDCGLTDAAVIADIGSGTGILTELFLREGNRVFGIEPNREMREAGERLLAGYPGFKSIAAAAEETTLADRSVDFIVAGQAFHWFDRARARAEFRRILKPGGWIALVWNERLVSVTPFLADYEEWLKTYATDYTQVDHRQIDERVLAEFFAPDTFTMKSFPNRQVFDFAGVKGRALSSSYVPEADHPRFAEILAELERIYQRHAAEGTVSFEYETRIYYGQVRSEW
ncbi:MAG TPA: class I SAM-dependent methyltransferase [Blastocatellia bacterium]|nr:class I SAM-dependent methyltransferase [Blastocatellia bacterium]